jgi:hypothetical protein
MLLFGMQSKSFAQFNPRNNTISYIENVSGDEVFSGRAVVVSVEILMKIAGSADKAIVAIYTWTGVSRHFTDLVKFKN